MNRQEKRHPKEHIRRTPTIEEMAIERANEYMAYTSRLVKECYFKAMRNNGISEIRAKKIVATMEELLISETK